jgi:hypothetical protein
MKTFNDILQELGIHSPDEFYEIMKEHWGNNVDAILTYDPKSEKIELGSIYSSDRFNLDCGQILLLRLNLPHKEKFDYLWHEIVYEADKILQRIQKNEFRAF